MTAMVGSAERVLVILDMQGANHFSKMEHKKLSVHSDGSPVVPLQEGDVHHQSFRFCSCQHLIV